MLPIVPRVQGAKAPAHGNPVMLCAVCMRELCFGSAQPAGMPHTEHDGRRGARGDSGRGFDHQHGARLKAPGRTPRFTAGRNRSQDRRQCLAAPCAYGEQEKRAHQQPQPLLRLHACALQRLPPPTGPLLLDDRSVDVVPPQQTAVSLLQGHHGAYVEFVEKVLWGAR